MTDIPLIKHNINFNKEIAKTETENKELNQKKEDVQKIEKVAKEFESVLIQEMLQEMNKTVPKDNLFGENQTTEFIKDMHNEALAKHLSENGGLGLAKQLIKEFNKKY